MFSFSSNVDGSSGGTELRLISLITMPTCPELSGVSICCLELKSTRSKASKSESVVIDTE